MTSRSGIVDPSKRPALPLVEGHLVRCPKCLELRHPDRDLKRLHRNVDYAMDLAVIYQCRRDRDGCGHVFAPSDQRIFLAFLSGDLIPAQQLHAAQARISELESQLGNQVVDVYDDGNSGDKTNEHDKVVTQ